MTGSHTLSLISINNELFHVVLDAPVLLQVSHVWDVAPRLPVFEETKLFCLRKILHLVPRQATTREDLFHEPKVRGGDTSEERPKLFLAVGAGCVRSGDLFIGFDVLSI